MKLNKRKRGISLIVLVITIIVMIILAAAIILALDSNNITGRANEARSGNDKSLIKEEAIVAKAEALLECQQHGIVLDQNKLIEKLGEYFKGSSIEENVVVVDNIWDVVVEDNLEITVAKHETDKILNGKDQSFHTMAPSTLTFRSNSDISNFKEVQINGKTVDPSNYIVTEGSTIVTLKSDYLKTLPKGTYDLKIVSKTGAAKTNFEVVKPDLNEYGFYYNQPYTADVSALGGKIALFIREDGTYDSVASNAGGETGAYKISGDNIVAYSSMGQLNCTILSDRNEIYCQELGVSFVLGDETFAADEEYVYIYDNSLDGYHIKAIDRNVSVHSSIPDNINNKPVVGLAMKAFEYSEMKNAPEMPDSIVYIGESAFTSASKLETITFGNNVRIIGETAFNFCENLKSIIIPNSVTTISRGAFRYCTSLESVYISKSVQKIEDYIFESCNKLTDISFEGTIDEWNSITLGINWTGTGAGISNVPATEVKCADGAVKLK